VQPASMYKGSP